MLVQSKKQIFTMTSHNFYNSPRIVKLGMPIFVTVAHRMKQLSV
jgi:hypothetical protein